MTTYYKLFRVVAVNIKAGKSITDSIKLKKYIQGDAVNVKSLTFVAGKGTLTAAALIFTDDGEDLIYESVIIE